MNYDPNNILNSEETNFVKLSVYQSLEAENARLNAEVEKYRRCFQAEGDWVLMEPGEHAMLMDKVKRLTNAGDEMAKDLLKEFGRKEMLKYKPYQNWKAAKEARNHG